MRRTAGGTAPPWRAPAAAGAARHVPVVVAPAQVGHVTGTSGHVFACRTTHSAVPTRRPIAAHTDGPAALAYGRICEATGAGSVNCPLFSSHLLRIKGCRGNNT
ncbi:hypothetical protein GCM10018787_34030 [Streptomyces thermodiastaticus]|nr:hypothetical protein GCM10018787_34030 [Streptomyces thermodiastaticus]